MNRCHFIDAARGAAIVPMVINHTGHAFLAVTFGASANNLFYLTETTAAPLFLFIAGFSLTLSWARAATTNRKRLPWIISNILRAVFLFALGYFLNLLLFPGQLQFLTGPLQTIGLATLVLIPVMPLFAKRWARYFLAIAACVSYGIFLWYANALTHFILFHQAWGGMLFFSLPPWPWLAMVVLGAASGGSWCAATTARAQLHLLNVAARWGGLLVLVGLVGYLQLDWHDYSFFFSDYTTWLPGLGTALWMTGIIPLVLLVAYHLQEWEKLPLWLLNFGRNALLIYAIHRLFIVAIMQNLFHFELGSISGFIVVNLALLFVLNELARLVNQLRALRVSHAQTDGV